MVGMIELVPYEVVIGFFGGAMLKVGNLIPTGRSVGQSVSTVGV
jgi:hypothetical protein